MKMQRTKVLIYPRFQLSFLAHTVGSAFVILTIFFAGNRYFLWKFAEKGHEVALPENHVFFQFLKAQQYALDWVFALSGLIALGFLFFYGLYLSHRVVGPLVRLQRYLNDLADGKDSPPLQFRSDDYFQEVAESLNASLARIRERERQEKDRKSA